MAIAVLCLNIAASGFYLAACINLTDTGDRIINGVAALVFAITAGINVLMLLNGSR